MSKKFLLDANVFIEARRRYYSFQLVPGFWESLIWYHNQNRLESIDRVKVELIDEELEQWAEKVAPPTFFVSTDESAVIDAYGKIQSWAQGHPQFSPEAKAEFASNADAWLVAYAKVKGLVLITQEVLAPESRKKIPIPNVCIQFGVPYGDTFQMLKELGVELTWSRPS